MKGGIRMQNASDFLVVDSFASAIECAAIIEGFRLASMGSWARSSALRTEVGGRALIWSAHPASQRLRQLRRAAVERVQEFFGLAVCYPENTLITEMRLGDSHVLHADAERELPEGGWEPNHTFWRSHTALIYLNTNGVEFDGGILRLPVFEAEVIPIVGKLVAINCTRRHRHEVTEVTRGSRVSLAIWMTTDEARAESWD